MAIRERGNKYQVDVKVNGIRVREAAPDKKAAEALEIEIKHTLNQGLPWVKREKANSNHAITRGSTQEYIELAYRRHWRHKRTGADLKRNAEIVLECVGDPSFPINQWDNDTIDRAIEVMEAKGNAQSSINRRLSAINVVLKLALDAGVIQTIPRIRKRKETQGRIRTLDNVPIYGERFEKEMLSYLKERGADKFHDFCIVMIDTGARNGELRKLEREDIEPDRIFLWGEITKSGKFRKVPLTDRARAALYRNMTDSEDPKAKPFGDVTKMMTKYWWREIKTHFKLESVEDFVPYCMRHTCASRLARKGASAGALQQWMGHSDLRVTQRYIHMHDSDLDGLRDLLQ